MYPSASAHVPFDSDEQRIESFGLAIDAISREVEADLGEKDAAHIERIGRARPLLSEHRGAAPRFGFVRWP